MTTSISEETIKDLVTAFSYRLTLETNFYWKVATKRFVEVSVLDYALVSDCKAEYQSGLDPEEEREVKEAIIAVEKKRDTHLSIPRLSVEERIGLMKSFIALQTDVSKKDTLQKTLDQFINPDQVDPVGLFKKGFKMGFDLNNLTVHSKELEESWIDFYRTEVRQNVHKWLGSLYDEYKITPGFPLICIYKDRALDIFTDDIKLRTINVYTFLKQDVEESRLYDRNGKVWTFKWLNDRVKDNFATRLLANTIYNPVIKVELEWILIGEYTLDSFKSDLFRAIDNDKHDLITQFEAPETVKEQLTDCDSFDKILDTIKKLVFPGRFTALSDKINQLEFRVREDGFLEALNKSYELGSVNLTKKEKALFRYDLDFFYHKKGRWLVNNTFAGGIIFLREPETINRAEIQFHSDQNTAIASVEYASAERNARNVKYKPSAGQIESITWSMAGIFPNFNKHPMDIKLALMAIIGKLVKHTCEDIKKNSWFMQYEKPFNLELFLDGKLELTYNLRIE